MMISSISAGELERFKTIYCNENKLIAESISELLPPSTGGIILDVGAGLGDVADMAFRNRKAILLDVLTFESPVNLHHERLQLDFFDFSPESFPAIDAIILSHVLQYLDDQPARLNEKLLEIDAGSIITVTNDSTRIFNDLVEWYVGRGINQNGEMEIGGFPPIPYGRRSSRALTAVLRCPSFSDLARQLTQVIFDTPVDDQDIAELSMWLTKRLDAPSLEIPQTVTLYGKKQID